ncbi:MAG: hypothetical protein M5T61_16875 [Acidimicrobiia bacterium]|nr:hypothetical protein [Acidimicrobiia bacterium]
MTGFRFVEEHQAEYRVTDLCCVAGGLPVGLLPHGGPARCRPERSLTPSCSRVIREDPPQLPRHLRAHRGAGSAATGRASGEPPSCRPAHALRRSRRRSRTPQVASGGRHPAMVPAADLLNDFTAERSDLRWVADISEFAAW